MLTLDNFRYFIEIAKDMNLTLTARRLYVTQQSLSGHIRRLEAHYGVKLVKRSPSFSLTEDGKRLVRESQKILTIENSLLDYYGHACTDVAGTIRVACSFSRIRTHMSAVINRFSELYPKVEVEFIDADSTVGNHMLKNGSADVCICNSFLEGSDIVSHELVKNYEFILMGHKLLRRRLGDKTESFLAKASHGVELQDLPPGETLICPQFRGRRWKLLEYFPELEQLPRKYTDANTPDVFLSLCKEGRGIVTISGLYVHHIRETYSAKFLDGIYFFPLLRGGERFHTIEQISYRMSLTSENYFREFIRITEDVFRESTCAPHNETFSAI